MREQVDAIVEALRAALVSGVADEHTFEQTLASMKALVPETEIDRVHHLAGHVHLMDVLIEHAGGAARQQLLEQRAEIAAQLLRQYGSTDTPHWRSRAIVERVAAQMAAGDDPGKTAASAVEEIELLGFTDSDIDVAGSLTANVAVNSLCAAHQWLAAYDTDQAKKSDLVAVVSASLRMYATAWGIEDVKRDSVLDIAQAMRSGRLALDDTDFGHARALMVLLGLALRANPAAMPALEEVCLLVAQALAEAGQAREHISTKGTVPAKSDFDLRCDKVLADFEHGLKEQGYEEYLLQQANADLVELQPQSEDDRRAMRKAIVRLCDVAMPHAPPEAAQTLLASREYTLQLDAPPLPPLDAAGLQVEGEALLQRLRDELAGGGFPGLAGARAQFAIRTLLLRISDADEETAKVVLRIMSEIVAILAPYAEPDKATLAADLTTTIRQAFGELETVLEDDSIRGEVAGQAAKREMNRLLQSPTSDPYEQPAASPHQRQFASLLRPWTDRLGALPREPADSRDVAEATRISKRAEVADLRLRAAITEAQWIEQQRGSFRRVALDLRQFERRHHLMLIEPPWPAHPATVDANALFFSGTRDVQAVLEAACARIGMMAPVTHGTDDLTHTRWDLLRRSALAAFDFTGYDCAASDPPGGLPRSSEKREAIARAAAPVARVAYEYGWALVLGTALVTIAHEGQALPFDIDIEPVRLSGDGDSDAMRVVLGLQAALLGVQRGLRTTDLAATVARLREHFTGDVKAGPLLDTLAGSHDAMQVQLTAEALLERETAHRAMLALPAFSPVYPNANKPRTLFHVTAFRPWSKPCEKAVRQACSRAGMTYLIGYERLDPDILRAIWCDIAGASFVVADLTSLNPNVALELGIAQALGRPTLVLTQTPNLAAHFQPLTKVRTHSYATNAEGKLDLARLLDGHLQSE